MAAWGCRERVTGSGDGQRGEMAGVGAGEQRT